MTEDLCLRIAEKYLSSNAIEYILPGRIGSKEPSRWEAIYVVPAETDPTVAVVDPPDVRVWVTLLDGQVEWIHQM
ncbi:hypothetical protein IGS59_27595 [Janthinobacterium sp. GW460P]|uniref:hypothetical protein n=1 Tax=unclassified Janthinobacterium TaxID=2610881 RepID=UPI000A344524|nr:MULTISPECIES: hypothetical protein [unclassified Janthinobacterium]MCC7706013.1 hypothetical protein [Janthinobacterium sp. GW460P]MCC7711515.1 hypothetical protein [Janthinobacterium sp. GW460W]